MPNLKESKFNQTFKSIDQFGESIGLKIDGDDFLRSKIGSVLTILVAIVAVSYAGIKG